MTVWVVHWEYNLPTDGEVGGIVGVYGQKRRAQQARRLCVKEFHEEGRLVWGEEGGEDWDVDVKIEPFELELD